MTCQLEWDAKFEKHLLACIKMCIWKFTGVASKIAARLRMIRARKKWDATSKMAEFLANLAIDNQFSVVAGPSSSRISRMTPRPRAKAPAGEMQTSKRDA